MKIIIKLDDMYLRNTNNHLLKKCNQLKFFNYLNKKSIFEMERNGDDTVSFKTFNNKYLTLVENNKLICEKKNTIGCLEKFILIPIEGTEKVIIKSYNGVYLEKEKDIFIRGYNNTPENMCHQFEILSVTDEEILKIKKDNRIRIKNNIKEGFRTTGIILGATIYTAAVVIDAIALSKGNDINQHYHNKHISYYRECQICGQYLINPKAPAHIGGKRHQDALKRNININININNF